MSDDTIPETAVSRPEPSEEPLRSGEPETPGAAEGSASQATNGSGPRPDGAPRRRRRGSRGRPRMLPVSVTPFRPPLDRASATRVQRPSRLRHPQPKARPPHPSGVAGEVAAAVAVAATRVRRSRTERAPAPGTVLRLAA